MLADLDSAAGLSCRWKLKAHCYAIGKGHAPGVGIPVLVAVIPGHRAGLQLRWLLVLVKNNENRRIHHGTIHQATCFSFTRYI